MATAIGYDKFTLNHQILVDLTLEEGVGLFTHDRSGTQHILALNGPPVWTQIARGLTVLDFDGAADYLDCPAADTADLDFTTGSYTLSGWINHNASAQSKMVMGRYALDTDGWELYLYDNHPNYYLQLRHHHVSQAPTLRSGSYSNDWTLNQWHMFGITKHSVGGVSFTQHYRNGEAVETTAGAGGVLDPDAATRDLVIGTRFTKDSDWYEGMQYRPRIWGRELQDWEMKRLFNLERDYFGV